MNKLKDEAVVLTAAILKANDVGTKVIFEKMDMKLEIKPGKETAHLDTKKVLKALGTKKFLAIASVSGTSITTLLGKEKADKIIADAKTIDKIGDSLVSISKLSAADKKELAAIAAEEAELTTV
jgi:hypothetical protein